MDLLYSSEKAAAQQNGYTDMLKELQKRNFSGLQFAIKDFKPQKYVHCHARNPEQVWKSALNSDRVQWIIRQIVREERKNEADIVQEAAKILKELAYTDHMTVVRALGYALYKVVCQIYMDGVFVNTDGIEKIRAMIKHHPVVFMPSHRSYMDFLLLTLVCYYADLPLPAIAAGMDFMGMKVIGSALRACGAFFMRRSFGSDRLYWALFTEYVHTILINGDRPMEFFIEGTRSRTGKCLNPKFGLLSVIAEPYLKAQTYDVMVVPVSISYDRLLEEELYAYEMLGIPKPKESTTGLMKASTILKDNYGSVHFKFGNSLSLREYFGHLDRAEHACYPRYMLRLSSEEQKYMEILGYKILLQHQEDSVLSPWSVIALILSQQPDGLSLSKLLEELQWLQLVFMKCNIHVNWPSGSLRECMLLNLHRFKHVIKIRDLSELPDNNATVWVAGSELQNKKPAKVSSGMLNPSIIDETVNHIIVASYRNQLLHNLIRPALVAFVCCKAFATCNNEISFTKDECIKDFKFLRQLLSREFIFEPLQVDDDFEQGINFLVQCDALCREGNEKYSVKNSADKMLMFLKSTFSTFLVTYWMACQYLLSSESSHVMSKSYSQIQQWISGNLRVEGISYEMLSLNVISNAVHAFIDLGALITHKTKNQKIIELLHANLLKISYEISQFIEVPKINGTATLFNSMKHAKL